MTKPLAPQPYSQTQSAATVCDLSAGKWHPASGGGFVPSVKGSLPLDQEKMFRGGTRSQLCAWKCALVMQKFWFGSD